jgi:RNA polymerase sigma-70 factor (ECF subfamily)
MIQVFTCEEETLISQPTSILGEEDVLSSRVRDDPQAFLSLYRLYFPKVYNYISYRTNSQEDAEDLTSQTFLKAVESIRKFVPRGSGSFAAWLFKIAHNVVHDFYRASARTKVYTARLEDSSELASSTPPLDTLIAQQEQFARMRYLVRELSARQQEIITLRFFAGLHNKQIAKILKLDERTVASHLSRGIRELQRKYVAVDDGSGEYDEVPTTRS